ncbi:MAG: PHP domain-containing protein [Spirochaetaceae bacterium]|nr:PHP domain-containing protein [Spirochaetaceae bacterium]MBO5236287.1 PHP domain-containing protein [Spirochaetaceae bacterium]
MIDLHTHTKNSDGNLTSRELVFYAAEKGIKVLAITDHDTTDGLSEGQKAAKKVGIVFVPGVELNISWPTGEFHLLGLGLKETSSELNAIIQNLKQDRKNRNSKIIEMLQQDGFPISEKELREMFPDSNLGRPHIASFLVSKKICKNTQQAFDKYLGKQRPYYVNREGADLDLAIQAIKTSGGVPVLAHPLSLYISYGKIEPVLINLKERGIQGLEAFHPGARKTDALRLEELARKIGFFVTGGSDFHGEKIHIGRKIGHACGGEKIPERLWFQELLPKI